LSSAIV